MPSSPLMAVRFMMFTPQWGTSVIFGRRNKMDDTRIVSGFGKAVSAQEYVLVDEHGRTLAAPSATQGKPALTFYNGKGEIRAWFTLTAEERPDIRLFDDDGSEVW